MTKKEIITTLSIIEKQHIQEAIQKIENDGIPGNGGSYLYDAIDPESGKKYPPPFLLETAYKIASGKKLPKGFFDTIKSNGPHFEKLLELDYLIEAKWYDDLDLSSKVWSYKWLYTLTTNQWNRVLDIGKLILDKLDLKEDDSKLVISFRDDAKQRLAIIIGSKYVGGFYLDKGEIYVRFYVNQDFDISTDSRLSPDTFEFANKIGKLVYMKLDDWQGEQDPLCKRFINDIAHYYEIAPKTNWKRNHLPFMTNVIRSKEPRARFLSFVEQKPQERLIDIYKYYLKTTGNKEELYKWEIGKQFKDNWELEAKDFGAMLSSVKFMNLFSQQSTGFYNLARKNPEDAREFYRYLFDDSVAIKDRIEWAKSEGDELIKKWHPKWTTSGGDERTLSVLWAFNDLSRHAPYKSSFYTKYCELIGVKSASPGEKYEHYLELLDDLIKNYIVKDTDLLNLHNDTIDPKKHIADPKYHLLAQNMLYRILDGYWEWGEDAIEEGDGTQEASTNEQIHHWVYAPGENAMYWDDFFSERIMGLGWRELGDISLFESKKEIENKLQLVEETSKSKRNDAKANWDFFAKMKPGDLVIVNKGRNCLLGYGIITSDYYFDPERDDHTHLRKVDWKLKGEWSIKDYVHGKTLTDITWEKIEDPQFTYRHEQLLAAMGVGVQTKKKEIMPINQILYGPPGTGKTYTLKTEYFPLYTTTEAAITKDAHFENAVRDCSWWQVIAVALIQLGKSKVSAIAEHPWVVQKTNLSNSKTVRPTIWGQLQSHTIDSCEFVNVKSKQQPFIFNKTEDSYWEILEEEVKEQIPEIYELIDSVENFKPNPNKEIKRYVFTTFHQSFSYEDFIEGIKPIMSDEDGTGEVAYRIEDGVFKDLCKRAESDPNNRYAIFIDEINRGNVSAIFGELITLIETDKRKGAEHAMNAILPYSKAPFSVPVNVDIYGTMNTADRSVEALDTALRRRFSFTEMPPIYDIDEEKATLQYTYAGVVGSKLLETINNRIEKLLDRDHLIGHSYFLMAKGEDAEAKLIDSFYRNIIPLLQEYFYGDYAKIGAVLGSGFVFKNQEDSVIFGDGFNEEEYSDKDIYQIIDYRVANNPLIKTDMSFESAIQKLMNTPKEKASEPGA
jgi:hypothetical protein